MTVRHHPKRTRKCKAAAAEAEADMIIKQTKKHGRAGVVRFRFSGTRLRTRRVWSAAGDPMAPTGSAGSRVASADYTHSGLVPSSAARRGLRRPWSLWMAVDDERRVCQRLGKRMDDAGALTAVEGRVASSAVRSDRVEGSAYFVLRSPPCHESPPGDADG